MKKFTMEMTTTATTKTNGHILKERAPIILYIVSSYKYNGGQVVLIVYTIYRCGKEDMYPFPLSQFLFGKLTFSKDWPDVHVICKNS